MSLVDQSTANVLGAQSDTRIAAIISEIFITPRNLRLLPSDCYDLRVLANLSHGYPTPSSPLRFRPARLALRGWARAPRPCRAPCSPPTSGTHSYRHPHHRG